MHMTKHAFGVYRSAPPDEAVVARLAEGQPAAPPATGRNITDVYTGDARISAYTVVHARSGEPEWGLAVCDLPSGERAYARTEDPAVLSGMEKEEWVGAEVRLAAGDDRINRIVGVIDVVDIVEVSNGKEVRGDSA
jgi:acetyl-CoA C-acetyltransferase